MFCDMAMLVESQVSGSVNSQVMGADSQQWNRGIRCHWLELSNFSFYFITDFIILSSWPILVKSLNK